MSLNKRILGGIILVAGLAGIALTYKPAVNFFEDAAMSPTEYYKVHNREKSLSYFVMNSVTLVGSLYIIAEGVLTIARKPKSAEC